jgi:hypothetical protein
VLETQVAVAVAAAALSDPGRKSILLLDQEVELPAFERRELARVEHARRALPSLVEVLAHVGGDRVRRRKRGGLRVATRFGVEAHQTLGERAYVMLVEALFAQAHIGCVGVGQAAHVHCPLHSLPRPAQAMDSGRVDRDGDHALVHAGREPTVEGHLRFTIAAARSQRGEVEKAECDWFANLVHRVSGEKDARDVSLAQLHSGRAKVVFEAGHACLWAPAATHASSTLPLLSTAGRDVDHVVAQQVRVQQRAFFMKHVGAHVMEQSSDPHREHASRHAAPRLRQREHALTLRFMFGQKLLSTRLPEAICIAKGGNQQRIFELDVPQQASLQFATALA